MDLVNCFRALMVACFLAGSLVACASEGTVDETTIETESKNAPSETQVPNTDPQQLDTTHCCAHCRDALGKGCEDTATGCRCI